MTIPDELTIAMVYRLLDEEGLYMGASSALNVVAAYELAKKLGPGRLIFCFKGHLYLFQSFIPLGKTIVTILCDGAYRYATRRHKHFLRSSRAHFYKGTRRACSPKSGSRQRAWRTLSQIIFKSTPFCHNSKPVLTLGSNGNENMEWHMMAFDELGNCARSYVHRRPDGSACDFE